MTMHCLVVQPPRPGLALPGLVDGPLSAAAAAALAGAATKDEMRAAEDSGGELLVNYPTEDQLPAAARTGTAPEAELRALAEEALREPDAARFEVQVGSSFAARAGNAATHLLRDEGETSVAILRGTAPTLGRTALDGAAMRLRRTPVVVGPGSGGRVTYLGLAEPIDFDGAYDPPEVEDLARRGVEAGHAVEFLSHHPVIEDEAGLASLVAELRARERAGRNVPPFTAAVVDDLGLRVLEEDGGRRVVADGDGV